MIKNHKYKNSIKALTLSPLLLAMFPSYAQEENKDKAEEAIEVIEVTGFRGSLSRSLNAKRFAGNVTDAISAEDVGKSTDQNIADALQRITGVAISREGGEGTTISVRGAGPNLNNISLNGVALTSTDTSNSVDLSQFSSDILSSIEVVKTPSADHDEGSLGANVILKSFKPLNSNKDRRSFELQLRKNDFAESDHPDGKVGLSISEKFLDETFGVSVVASRETQTLRSDRYDNTWWRPLEVRNRVGRLLEPASDGILDPNDGNLAGAATNYRTNELVTEWDYNGDGVITADEQVIRGYANRQNRYSYNLRERDRDTINTTFQWLATEDTDVQLDLTVSSQDTTLDQNFFTNTTPVNANEPENIIWDPETYTFLKWTDTSNQIANGGRNRNIDEATVVVRNHRDIADTTQRNRVAALSVEHILTDYITLSVRAGRSESSQKDNLFLRSRFGSTNAARGSGLTTGYDCTLSSNLERCDQIVIGGNGTNFVANPDNYQFNVFNVRDRQIKDTSNSFYFDLDWDVEFGPITQIETGFKWNNRLKENREIDDQFNANQAEIPADERLLSDYTSGEFSPSNWGRQFGFQPSDTINGWPLADTVAMAQQIRESGVSLNARFNPINNRTIELDMYAAYIKANFSFFDDQLTGDIGGRYTKTDVLAKGFTGFNYQTVAFTNTAENVEFFGSQAEALANIGMDVNDRVTGSLPVSATNSYNNFLPSLNLNYILNDEMILRFAASKTLARPPIDDLKPGFNISESHFGPVSGGNIGATHLKPFLSTNLDLSFEWYFNDESLVAVTLFNKDFSDFAESSGFLAYHQDLRSTFYDENGDAYSDEELAEQGVSINVDDVVTQLSLGEPAGCMPNRENDLANPFGDSTCDIVDLQTSRNGSGGYVRGAEFNFQHNFSYLPSIWSGLGVIANYTYADSETDAEVQLNNDGEVIANLPAAPLQGTSQHTYNATLFWEQDGSLIRLAYNSRSDYLETRANRDGTTEWIEGFDTLDLSGNWKVTRDIMVTVQATNLLDTVERRFLTIREDSLIPAESVELGNLNTSRTSRLTANGRNYRVGIRINF